MIFLVTGRPECYEWEELSKEDICRGNFDEFVHWMSHTTLVNLDTETTVVEDGPNQHEERKLLVLQLGSIDNSSQWVIDMTGLPPYWLSAVKLYLSREDVQFFIHFATFEYLVIKSQLGISIENIHDTCLMSKMANMGIETAKGYHSLAGCMERFFDIYVSKEAQTSFTFEPLTLTQIKYAATDVVKLYDLFLKLKDILVSWGLWYLYDTWERNLIQVYGDMELNPMRFDSAYWDILSASIDKEAAAAEADLNKQVLADPSLIAYLKMSTSIIKDKLIQPIDEVVLNWGSTIHKNLALTKLVPSLPTSIKTKPDLKKWLKLNSSILAPDELAVLNMYIARQYDKLSEKLLNLDKQWMIDNGLFIPEDTIRINWASPIHKLYVFRFYYPKLVDTNMKSLANITKNPLINSFKAFSAANKMATTYGEGFKTKYATKTGTISPSNINQILSTGRVSFGILLQMPSKAKFRNAFLPPFEDWVFVDSDYSSAEVAIMSYAAGEDEFLDAIKTGKDLHMKSASLIFADKWKEIAEPGCTHLIDGSKCDCKEHNKLRKFSKTITFGLAYGLGPSGLADRLNISRAEAVDLMAKFFATFPKLKLFLDGSEKFSQANSYIVCLPPTSRVRFFEHPSNEAELAAIGREGKNTPIQECNASMLKIALVNLRRIIRKNNYPAMLHLPVHDEILSSCQKDFASTWAKIQDEEMRRAADMFLEPGLLGTDTQIMDKWTK